MNERKIAGANYIISYFNEIQNLKIAYSQYISYLIEVKTKYGDSPGESEKDAVSDEEKFKIGQLAQNVRHLCNLCFVSYNSIFSIDNLKGNEEIKELYYKVVNQYIINTKDLEKYVILLNKSLVNDIIKELLISSQETISEIYKNEE